VELLPGEKVSSSAVVDVENGAQAACLTNRTQSKRALVTTKSRKEIKSEAEGKQAAAKILFSQTRSVRTRRDPCSKSQLPSLRSLPLTKKYSFWFVSLVVRRGLVCAFPRPGHDGVSMRRDRE